MSLTNRIKSKTHGEQPASIAIGAPTLSDDAGDASLGASTASSSSATTRSAQHGAVAATTSSPALATGGAAPAPGLQPAASTSSLSSTLSRAGSPRAVRSVCRCSRARRRHAAQQNVDGLDHVASRQQAARPHPQGRRRRERNGTRGARGRAAAAATGCWADGRLASQAPTPTAVIELLRKELEDAHAQIETMELALAVANNKLVRAEHKTKRASLDNEGVKSVEAMNRIYAASRPLVRTTYAWSLSSLSSSRSELVFFYSASALTTNASGAGSCALAVVIAVCCSFEVDAAAGSERRRRRVDRGGHNAARARHRGLARRVRRRSQRHCARRRQSHCTWASGCDAVALVERRWPHAALRCRSRGTASKTCSTFPCDRQATRLAAAAGVRACGRAGVRLCVCASVRACANSRCAQRGDAGDRWLDDKVCSLSCSRGEAHAPDAAERAGRRSLCSSRPPS